MTPERWKKVQLLFEQAIKLDKGEQISYLEKECGDDKELLNEVLSLLNADEEGHSIFSNKPADFFSVNESRMDGKRFGNYRIIKQIGTGGMGAVYIAERVDGLFEQKVALKIVKPGMNSSEIIKRFEEERQILARLQHPNIARLLDGGILENGLPYFTMEYVEGTPITEYCDKNNLPVESRLELFQKVCNAVLYAHQKLVIHRDIKPSNILVQEDGTVKLLDFGIAKVFEENENKKGLTRTGIRLMTPEFASPEQVRGEAVSTATDIYSLGLILYQLLTGFPPYKVDTTSAVEMEKIICFTEAPKPSAIITKTLGLISGNDEKLSAGYISRKRSISIPKLKKKISGDLDNICLMALRKEPESRYNSVAQLTNDIHNFLNGLPVYARKSTASYRTKKFIKRHKAGVVIAAVAVAIIALVTTFYTISLKEERDNAKLEAEKSKEVSDFLAGLFEVSDPSNSKGETITAKELLESGARKIVTEMNNEPEVKAMMLDVIGKVYRTLGNYDKAEKYLLEGMEIRKKIMGNNSPDLALSYFNLGEMYHYKKDYKKAEAYYKKALKIRKNLYGLYNLDVAHSIDLLGRLMRDDDRFHQADSLANLAFNIRKKLTSDTNAVMVDSYHSLGMIAYDIGKYEKAEKDYRNEGRILKRTGKVYPAFLFNFATVLEGNGKYKEADSLFKESLILSRKYYGNNHPFVANCLDGYAQLKNLTGYYDTAITLSNEAARIREKVFGEVSDMYALSQNNLGRIYQNMGQHNTAINCFEKAIKIAYQIGDTNHAEGIYPANLAKSQYAVGDYDKSLKSWQTVLKFDRKTYGENKFVAEDLDYIARIYSIKGNLTKAEELYRESLKIHPRADAMISLGKILTGKGYNDEADTLLRKGLNTLMNKRPDDHVDIADAKGAIGVNLISEKRYQDAEPLLLESFNSLKKKTGPDDTLTVKAAGRLVKLYTEWGKKAEAAKYKRMLSRAD
jgi:serine/threonine protein kinase/Tfp pilus assembly protein PilF